ncbi:MULTISPECIES: GNAT family N-acetyltransferase [unclassified Gilliamella]|uniref:GNAT family N-acetyltransferase n=1 Tax=unclassified Gilliamella TaxID=2685620 RepID=UPI00080E45BC|nr:MULTISPECIES: GNAT family N-acetyltransferase [Gilliamella]MCX8640861.1 N-acetyltransferase [Gilliamella sp. B3835]MCX8707800.1 N-acetyltransferase [Gilliamella sp. B3783]MCX8709269.1 N-acetyltransferase [Gilliamella sp. B3780]MCX8713236.1 N-acetyltransferase [Gilliamella sp. B3468]MCX8713392.1 N-acetyltransferase [Gilliamella sp. B3781]
MALNYLEDHERFYVCDANNKQIAEMTFTRVGQNKATINHTYIDPEYRGKGIADKLLNLVVTKLQQEQREIIPICSYAAKKLMK